MKRLFILILVVLMMLSFAACKNSSDSFTDTLLSNFEKTSDKDAQGIADALINSSVIDFPGVTTPVEEGYLTGFGDAQIEGFDQGVMFGPTQEFIPFVGYVFDLSDDTDVNKFMDNLKENADLEFNSSADADKVVVDNVGDKVVVIITPDKSDEDKEEQTDASGNPVEDEIIIFGEEFEDDFDF